MMIWVPGKKSATSSGDQRIRLGRIVAAFKGGLVFISGHRKSQCVLVHCAFRRLFESELSHCRLRHIRRPRIQIGLSARQIDDPAIGGEGVGRCGPRTGNSSGLLPGSSSGRGLPGGLSCGGSDGCPGLIGGSSCGSIGVSLIRNNGAATAMFL